jgi:conjugal transfer mating pair stabilization protein TraG
MPNFTVYAYFNVNQLATLMDGIAAITASGNFLDVFRIVAIISFLVFAVGIAVGKAQEPFEFFRWLLVIVLIHSVLLIPKGNVVIIDRTGLAPPTVRANVPIGLAFFASVTSHVGDALTRAFEAVFALPDDLQFQKNGMMFGNTVLADSLQAVPTSPAFRDDLVKFINSCTYYDIIAGRVSQDAFARTDDIWMMMANTSNALSTPISTATDGSMICSDAYKDINSRWGVETTLTMQTRGRVLNPQAINNEAAGALLSSQLGNSYARLTNISKSSTEMLRQNMTLNSVRDSQMVSAQRLDSASAAIVGAAQSQAEISANTNYLAMARVAERAAPAIRNVVELICYAVFPVVLLLLVIAGVHAGTLLKAYVMSLVWIQLIPPLYAILNFSMTSATRANLVGIAESTSGVSAVNLVNIGQLSQHGLSDSAIAGYLTLSIPVIAWALVKGAEIGGSALFHAAMAPASGSAGNAADSLASGNINQGNVALDTTSGNNVNSNHYDTAPSVSSGFSKVSTAMGTSTIGTDGTYRFHGNQSALGFSANFGQKIGNSLSSEAAERHEVASRETTAATEMKTAALVQRMGIVRAFSSQHGTSNLQDATNSSRSSRAVSQLQQVAENVNERLGLNANSSVGQRIVGTLSMGGNIAFDAKIFGGKLGLANDKIDDASKRKQYEAAIGFAKDRLKSKNITAEQGLSSDFRSSEAYQWGRQNRQEMVDGEDAALTRATQHTRNAEVAKSQAFSLSSQARTVSENWLHSSMNYEGYLANRLHEDGKLEAFNMLYQSNPEQAARMAASYLAETNFDAMPTLPRISNDVQEVQRGAPDLTGKTISNQAQRIGSIPDGTDSTFHTQRASLMARGDQHAEIINEVGARVNAAATEAERAMDKEQSALSLQIATGKESANGTLQRSNQIQGLKGTSAMPGEGSAASQQDRVHKDLFGPTDEPKPKK